MINTMKVFYNGVKINGEKTLIKMNVYESDNSIRISYDWHWTSEFFKDLQDIVEYNFIHSEYWGDDGQRVLEVKPANPLYRLFKYMFLAKCKREKKLAGREKEVSALDAEMRKFPNYANPDMIAKTKEYILECKKAIQEKIEEQRKAEEAKRLAIFNAEKAQKEVIVNNMNRFPISSNMFVRICWSEHPAFYDWDDNTLEVSVKAAEMIFTELDKKPAEGGYYKTKFEIVVDNETVYTGRYDLGDEENGMFNHMTSFAEYERKHCNNEEEYAERIEFIQTLINDYENQKEVTVTISDEFKRFVETFKKNN